MNTKENFSIDGITEKNLHPDELQILIENYPSLLKKENPPICANVEQNFIRGLLIELYKEKFKEFFTDKSLPIPKFVEEPICIRDDVKFIGKLGAKEKFRNQTVLLKPSIGWNSGVIISGPYSGLILDFSITLGFKYKTTVANRMWDNKETGPRNKQYNIKIHDIRKKMEKKEFAKLTEELQTLVQRVYSQWISDHSDLRRATDHMQYLCAELGISLEKL